MGYALPIEQDKRNLDFLWWTASISLLGLGIYVATASWIAGLIIVGVAALISPYAFTQALEKLKLTDQFHARVLIVFVALVWSTYVLVMHTNMIATEQKAHAELETQQAALRAEQQRIEAEKIRIEGIREGYAGDKEKVLSDFGAAIDAGDINKASALHNQYALIIKDLEFVAVDTRFKALQAKVEQAQQEQARLGRIAVLQGQIKTLTATDYATAITIYRELTKLDPATKSYQQNLDRFTKAEAAAREKIRKAEALAAERAEHQKKIEAQFSGWDGSHRELERMIKDSMNDPDSYEHVETRYSDKGTYIRVFCTFRGKNAFGGIVKNTKTADFDLDGNYLREIQ